MTPLSLLAREGAMLRDLRRLEKWKPVRYAAQAKVARGFDPQFATWLKENGFGSCKFADPTRPAYGGQSGKGQALVLIHGNSSSAEDFAPIIPQLEQAGIRVFAMSYGDADKKKALFQHDSKAYVDEVAAFIEAVSEYTGGKVDIEGHSLGNLLIERALTALEANGLTPARNVITAAAANQGLVPNLGEYFNPVAQLLVPSASAFDPLRPLFGQMRERGIPAEHVYSLYGTGDAILGWDATRTGPFPNADHDYELPLMGHFPAMQQTGRLVGAIVNGTVPSGLGWQGLVDWDGASTP